MKLIKKTFFPLEYQMSHTYSQAPVSTQISNQPQSQYSVVNNQQTTQSPPASQQSSVIIMDNFSFKMSLFFIF